MSPSDCPEIRGQCEAERELATEAKEATTKLVVGKKVTMDSISKDKYFRFRTITHNYTHRVHMSTRMRSRAHAG